MREDAKQKILDILISEAEEEVMKRSSDEIDERYPVDKDYQISPEHERYMESLIRKHERAVRREKRKKSFSRIAAAAAAVIVVSSVAVYNVDAVKIRIKNMVLDIQDTHTSVSYTDNSSYQGEIVSLEYVPEGFELEKNNVRQESGHVFLAFKNGKDWFHISVNAIGDVSSYDTEDAKVSYIEINGSEAFVSVKKDLTIVVWHDTTHEYSVTGNISKKEAVKIAKNFRKNY